MTRKSFVGLAGAVVLAAVFANTLAAQGAAGSQAPAKAATPKAAPAKSAPAKANPDMKGDAAPMKEDAPKSQASTTMKGSNPPQAVPATTPTPQPTTGNSDTTQPPAGAVMSVHIPRKVMADGKPLAAGTYQLRVTDQSPSPVVGQTPAETRWVEFVQGGQVKGREVGTIKSTTEAKRIAKQGLPGAGSAKIQELYGNDYLRVWINKGGTNYLVHLPNS